MSPAIPARRKPGCDCVFSFELWIWKSRITARALRATRADREGIGLVAMRERAELMGGQISFALRLEGGTLVQLTFPRQS